MAAIAFLEPYLRSEKETEKSFDTDQLIRMLFLSALNKIDHAQKARGDGMSVEQGFYVGRTTSIVDALRDAIDMESGGQTAQDYDRVYDHIDLCLQIAVKEPESDALQQAREALSQLSACWQANACKTSWLTGTA